MNIFGRKSNDEAKSIKLNEEGQQLFQWDGTELSNIDEKRADGRIDSKEKFFAKSYLNPTDFKYILAACFRVVNENAKIVIVFNENIIHINQYVLSLLIYIKICMPDEMVEIINFSAKKDQITIYKEKNKKKLKKIQDVYFFDFKSQSFILKDLSIKSEYLELVFESINRREKLIDFMLIASTVVYNKFSLGEYDKISTIFNLNENREKIDEEQRVGLLKELYEKIINSDEGTGQKNYAVFFANILEEEFKSKKNNRDLYNPSEQIVDIILNFYNYIDKYFDDLTGENIKKVINAYLLLVIADGKSSGKLDYVKRIFLKANTNPLVFRKLIDILFVNDQFVEDILKWYILDELEDAKELDGILNHVSFWAKTSPKVINMDFFVEYIQNKLIDISETKDRKADDYTIIYNYLKDFEKLCPTKEDEDKYIEFENKIKNKIYVYTVESIDLTRVTYENILAIDLQDFEKEDKKCETIYYLQGLFSEDTIIKLKEIENFICSLSTEEMFNVENQIQNYYKDKINEKYFRKIMVGFVEQAVYLNNIVLYNVDSLMGFIYENESADMARQYIAWVSDNFIELNEQMVQNRFKSGLFSYFYEFDREAFKNASFSKLFSKIQNRTMRKMIKEIRKQLPGNFERMVTKISSSKTRY
ncbi:hypothetical protein [Clostridium akagii]|uniref:hypothetical protein n=1 Tax=Clostridium akagii TaxID=91623 RepID=UPI00047C78E8|nr:hypothetical protein [Clostridium akagii]